MYFCPGLGQENDVRSSPSQWYAAVREEASDDWVQGLQLGVYYLYVGLWLTLTTRFPFGTNIYERDWDLLIILDACRVDALEAVAEEYPFLDEVDSIVSLGSTSGEWVGHTFCRAYADEVERTAYVTANPHSQAVLADRRFPPQYVAAPVVFPDWSAVEPSRFALLDEVWRDGRLEEDTESIIRAVPPRTVTDRAIRAFRTDDTSRRIVHYMQPHAPYLRSASTPDDPTVPGVDVFLPRPFEALKRGEVPHEGVWEAYLDTLRLVLDEVAVLLRNVDADRVAITADHGEAFGELGFYEHPVACPHPVVKRVPWAETTAEDAGTRDPIVDSTAHRDADTYLEDLGYL